MSYRYRRVRTGAAGRVASGYLLLEVVMSVTLLVLGLTYIGAQVQKARASAYKADELTRVLMLAESKLAELDTGLVPYDEEADDEIEGDFTLRFPHYGWRIRVRETATEDLWAITLEILEARRESLDDEFDLENAKVVYAVHTLRAEPAVINVETDLGLDEETINGLAESLPAELFDPPYLPPSAFQGLDFPTLVEVLPALISLFGENADPLLASLPPEFRAMLDLETGQPASEGGARDEPLGLSDEDLNAFNMNREEFNREFDQRQPGPGGNVERNEQPRGRGDRRPQNQGGVRSRGRRGSK